MAGKSKRALALTVLALAALAIAGCKDMGRLVIFSALEGDLVDDGRPLAGATVTRSWNWPWGKEERSDTAVTDSNGHFQLPEVSRSSLTASMLPHEPNIYQKITVDISGTTIDLWEKFKSNYKPGGETGKSPIRDDVRVRCDVAWEIAQRGPFYGRCELIGTK